MRANQTPAERRMWAMLGGSRLGGLKFRRQAVIGIYIVDFLCPALAPIVEIDGESHDNPDRDAHRDARLLAQGYQVMRFTNAQMRDAGDMVARAIMERASSVPARWANGPRNPPQGGSRANVPTPYPSPEGKGS
jgi:very-short-patch-repair endonuclease